MTMAYYAVCDAGGPISVKLEGTTETDALAAFEALDGHACIDGASTDLEDALDISGEGMGESAFAAALEVAGAIYVRDLSPAWTLWAVMRPKGDEQ
jgi:hypothetical protein